MDLLQAATKIYQAALKAVNPEQLIQNNLFLKNNCLFIKDRKFDLSSFKNVYLIALGKAAPFMASAALNVLSNWIKKGIIVSLPENKIKLKNITFYPGSHPIPDEQSMEAANQVLKFAQKVTKEDLAIFLISGGGSALLCKPLNGISLEEKKAVTQLLLRSGADISEINTVRKHLSQIKGGRLAQAIYPGSIINLVVSDVIRNSLENIISGPTYWDSSTFQDAYLVVKKYNLLAQVPPSVQKIIIEGMRGNIEETPKRRKEIFKNVHSFIIGDNSTALQAGLDKAQKFNFNSLILTSSDSGEARGRAVYYTSFLKKIIKYDRPVAKPACLLAGGELTVTVKGKGKGGRNQEFVLASLIQMSRDRADKNWLILSLGTDGIDGPTDAAGAWATEGSLINAENLGLNPHKYLANNDSYNFFNQIGGLIKIGPTKTNVMDIRIFLVDRD
ncbi:MAG: glycerate kinase [Candidatus Aminicenantia bacterium]